MIIIKAKNIHKEYVIGSERVNVLKGVSLDIEKNAFVGIVGPSGAGKSTLLHILGSLDKPTKGEVLYHDTVNIYALRDSKRSLLRNKKVGFVFQFYYLLPEFTAVENVMMPALVADNDRARDVKEVKNRASQILEEVGLASRMNHKPRQLSGGEQQRVAIARALMNNPDILFADEPTGNLDSAHSESIIDLLMKLHDDKKQTIVMVTHDNSIAARTHMQIHMSDGRIDKMVN
ncbi:MAG: ABC transporter ATP-binding protein [Candidatus Ancaeobacter aquaticus]|nr:ABC transporter ATP-binding protein [Candidatus Ancaeobacter aquaticus]